MAKLLSILIPIYNVEDYLDECLRSVLAQDLDPDTYEVILTDDGSTDRSGEIAQALAKEYPTLHYYHKENGGLSSARNAGLARATGKYLLHIDSDDWLEPGVLPGVVEDMERRALDLCLIDWIDRYPDGTSERQIDYSGIGEQVLEGEEVIRSQRKYATSWSFLMRRSVVEEGDLSFIPVQPGEDIAFFISAMPHCHRVGYHPALLYNYRRDRPGAITQGPKASKELEAAQRLLHWIDATYPYPGSDYAAALGPWYDDILADMAMRKIALAGEEKRFAEIMHHFSYRYRAERGARRAAFFLLDKLRHSYPLSSALWSLKRLTS